MPSSQIPSLWQTTLGLPDLGNQGRDGVQVTGSGTAHTKGSWFDLLLDPTDHPTYGIVVAFMGVGVSATATAMLVDIGFGPTGGGSETVVLPNLNAWGAPGTNDPGNHVYVFPGVYIPAGVRVSARNQGVIVSDTADVCVWLGQNAPTPFIAGAVSDYGTVLATSIGTLVTPGNDAFGTYIEIGTTDRDHTMWTFGMDGQTETLFTGNQNVHVIEIGFGPDNSNVTRIGSRWRVPFGTSEEIASTIPPYAYAVVPRGTKLWCRIAGGDADVDPRGIIIYGWD